MRLDQIKFQYQLNTKVYWRHGDKPIVGTIKRRGYQETWQDPDYNDPDDKGGYLSNIFYECHSQSHKAIFHESDFGKRVFVDAEAFMDYVMS